MLKAISAAAAFSLCLALAAGGSAAAEGEGRMAIALLAPPMSVPPSSAIQIDCKNRAGSLSACRAWCANYDKERNAKPGSCAARNCTGCPKP